MNRDCVKCGKCKSVCPTFKVALTEEKSPRGRVFISELILNGERDFSFVESIYSCLMCMACEEACPQGVDITEIIKSARKALSVSLKLSFLKDLKPAKLKNVNVVSSSHKRCGVFLGCLIPLYFPQLVNVLLDFLKELGYNPVVPVAQKCCGYPLESMGDPELAEKLIGENKRLFDEFPEIITACATCSAYLKKRYPWKDKVKDITELVIKYAEVLTVKDEYSYRLVGFHHPCHLNRSQGINVELEQALSTIFGNNFTSIDDYSCCGFGGVVSAKFPSLSLKIGKERISAFVAKGVSTILTACPACMLQLQKASVFYNFSVNVKHVVELTTVMG